MNNYNGTITTIGFSILKFSSSPTLSALTVIISKYLNCDDDIIDIMGICEVTDGKINTLFKYNKKEMKDVKSYFKPYIYSGSDHVTALNIYKQLYLTGNTRYLNKKTLETIKDRIKQIDKSAKSISDEQYEYMNNKYKIVKIKPYSEKINNIIYTLGLSHKYNLIKQKSKLKYTSLNYFKNSDADIEFCEIMGDIKLSEYAICHTLVNAFGNKSFQCITQIPSNILKDMK